VCCIVDCVGTDFSTSEYPVCGERHQSPVNIEPSSTVFESGYTNLMLHSYATTPANVSFQLANTGHSGLYSDDILKCDINEGR